MESWSRKRCKEEKAKKNHAALPTTMSTLFHLWYEKEKHGLRKVTEDGDDRECHSGEIAERVTNKHARRVPEEVRR